MRIKLRLNSRWWFFWRVRSGRNMAGDFGYSGSGSLKWGWEYPVPGLKSPAIDILKVLRR
jgi:hypothetical protein